MSYFYLILAIITEVIATLSLKASEQFTKIIPTVIITVGYASSFYFLSLSLKTIPVGIAYAIWSGIGTVLIALGANWYYKQGLNSWEVFGMALVICGVIIMNLFSKNTGH